MLLLYVFALLNPFGAKLEDPEPFTIRIAATTSTSVVSSATGFGTPSFGYVVIAPGETESKRPVTEPIRELVVIEAKEAQADAFDASLVPGERDAANVAC